MGHERRHLRHREHEDEVQEEFEVGGVATAGVGAWRFVDGRHASPSFGFWGRIGAEFEPPRVHSAESRKQTSRWSFRSMLARCDSDGCCSAHRKLEESLP